MKFSLMTCLSTVLVGLSTGPSALVEAAPAPAPWDPNEVAYTSDANFQRAMVNPHNVYRQQHRVSNLSWDSKLAGFASNYLAKSNCKFEHSGGPYGENLALGYSLPRLAVEAWGNERSKYDFNKPHFSGETGHFTQVVWKGTRTVGCARRFCQGKGWYVACEYFPRGNVLGSFSKNVFRQQ